MQLYLAGKILYQSFDTVLTQNAEAIVTTQTEMGQKSIVLVVCALICGIQACKHQILKMLTFCSIHCVISWEIHLTHEEVPSMTLEIYKGAKSHEQEKT